MKRVALGLIIVILLSARFDTAVAELPDLLFVEIQTASTLSASAEFIRIANTTDHNIDLSKVKIEYFSANPKDILVPSRSISLNGNLLPKDTFLVSSKGYRSNESNQEYSATLASSGGHIQLKSTDSANSTVYDFVGWGTAMYPKVLSATAPKAGEILKRKVDPNGNYLFSGNNNLDFEVKNFNDTESNIIQSTVKLDYSKIQITELLPNPASPLNDIKDEFIEIYNSGSEEINLNGLILYSGIKLDNHYILKNNILKAGQYQSYYSKDTKLTLSNTTSKVTLKTAEGLIIDESDVYTNAKPGESYSFDGSVWHWTNQITPNQANVFFKDNKTEKPSENKSNTNKKIKSGNSRLTVKKTRIPQVKSAKTSIPKVAETQTGGKVHTSVIAGVGSFGLLYGLYEYREDIRNFIYKVRKRRED